MEEFDKKLIADEDDVGDIWCVRRSILEAIHVGVGFGVGVLFQENEKNWGNKNLTEENGCGVGNIIDEEVSGNSDTKHRTLRIRLDNIVKKD